jgi:hypothetical protein
MLQAFRVQSLKPFVKAKTDVSTFLPPSLARSLASPPSLPPARPPARPIVSESGGTQGIDALEVHSLLALLAQKYKF